jgi:von Willebrand factor type A domain
MGMFRPTLGKCGLFLATVVSALVPSCASQIVADQCSEIHTSASVLNERGQVIAGLSNENFTAQIGGKPARITNVEYKLQKHRAVILIDHSGSMGWLRWQVTQEAIQRLVLEIPQDVPVGIIVFDDKIHQLVPLKSDRKLISESLRQYFSSKEGKPRGRTNLFGAIDAALSSLLPTVRGDLIYVVTDAGDNQSQVSSGKLEKKLLNSEVRLFALFLGPTGHEIVATSEEREGEDAMEHMVRLTGGIFARVPVPEPDPQQEETNLHLTQKDLDRLSVVSVWLMQNMIDSYDFTLVPSKIASGRAKLKLQAKIRKEGTKFRVITPTVVSVNCP